MSSFDLSKPDGYLKLFECTNESTFKMGILNLFTLIQRQKPPTTHPASRASFVFFFTHSRRKKTGPCLNRVKLKSCSSPNFCVSQHCFLSSNSFLEWEHLFIDKPMVKTIPRARLLGLELNQYPSNKQRMLNKDLKRYIRSLFRVRQSGRNERRLRQQSAKRLDNLS